MPPSVNKTILVVDEDPDLRVFVTTQLAAAGYRPVAVNSEAEGLRQCRCCNPALIIIDATFREKSSLHFYRDVKTDRQLKDIPVILVSRLSKRVFDHFKKLNGAWTGHEIPEPEGYLDKPTETGELMEMVRCLTVFGTGSKDAPELRD